MQDFLEALKFKAKRLTTLPQALFVCSQKNGSHVFGSHTSLTTLPQALFLFRKMPPRRGFLHMQEKEGIKGN